MAKKITKLTPEQIARLEVFDGLSGRRCTMSVRATPSEKHSTGHRACNLRRDGLAAKLVRVDLRSTGAGPLSDSSPDTSNTGGVRRP